MRGYRILAPASVRVCKVNLSFSDFSVNGLKSLLDPQCILFLEIFDGFCWIEVTVRFRFIVRVYGLGFGLELDITNSKKIKTMENLHMASFYVTYHLKKIINMSYGVFIKKPSQK